MEEFLKFGGWVVGLLGAVTAAWTSLKKTQVDESGQALQAWKDMTDRHEKEIASLKAECEDARNNLRQVEDACYDERQEFRSKIEGMQNQMLQLHASYLAQMTLLADPTNPDHVNLLQRASQLIEQVRKANETHG